MEPFNIHINHENEEVTLTVLPENNYYKLIYFGGIIGAIKEFDGSWELLAEDQIEAGGLPLYEYKHGVDNQPKLALNRLKINQITSEIEKVIY